MILIYIIILSIISFITVINYHLTKDVYVKLITFYYFISNLIQIIFLYFLYSHKFPYIINMIYPLLALNLISILFFIKNIDNNS